MSRVRYSTSRRWPGAAVASKTASDTGAEQRRRDAVRGQLWEVSGRLDAGDHPGAAQLLISLHPADPADILAELDDEERRVLLDGLAPDQLAPLLEHLTPTELDHVAPQLAVDEMAAALDEAPADAAADILHHLDDDDAQAVLEAMDESDQLTSLLLHEDESAGGIMSPQVAALRGQMTADNAIDYLRTLGRSAAEPYYLYVLEPDHHLEGVVGLRDLVVARPDRRMRELMNPDVISVNTQTDQEVVLPVVDADSRFAGVTTADDLLDVAQQEATEDMFRMVGLGAAEEVGGPVAASVGRRLPWLLVNLLTVFAAAATVSVFEDTLERAAVLAIFLPVVVGISANAGGQTLALVVRGIALGTFGREAWRVAIPREALIATINGLVVALVAWLWKGNPYVGLAMLAKLIVAGLAGVLIPATLRRLRADPALASSIFVTSITDIMGYFFYLGTAVLLIDRID
ncbi:MAG: magnesium transporter [Chloroflexi bacterium]|nr:MAG: magnesium transporter [Chloroflexota bacterium]